MQLTRKDVYVALIGPGMRPTDGTTAYLITQAYYDEAMLNAKTQIALAGARLANLLNQELN